MIIPSFHGIPYVSGRSCIRLMRVSAGERGGGHVIPAGVSCHWNTCSPGVFWPGTTFRSYFLCSQRVL